MPRAALLLAVLPLAGCAGMGTLSDVLGGDVSGEIRRVDERRQEIRVRTSFGGSRTVDYDRHTRVLYRQKRYPIRALEPGDQVSMRVQRDPRGGLYTDYIRVERSAWDRRQARDDRDWERGRSREVDRGFGRETALQGRVARVDRKAGWFRVRDDSRGWFVVTLPSRAASSTVKRFRTLRSGDYVRLDGTLIGRERVELRRFR